MPQNPCNPNDEPDVDREIRIERMKRELEELSNGSMISGALGEVSPAMEDAFLSHALAFERAELDTPFNRLLRCGVAMERPEELDHAGLSAKLNEVLRVLGTMRCYVAQTDHLSDRELYEWLWRDGLREETPDPSALGDAAWHTSPIGSCDDEDMAIHLKYYAGEEERRRWHDEYPNDPLPPHAPLPYNRDRKSPRAFA